MFEQLEKDVEKAVCKYAKAKAGSIFEVSFRHEGKKIYIGRYDSLKEAIVKRDKAKIEYGYHKNHGVIPC